MQIKLFIKENVASQEPFIYAVDNKATSYDHEIWMTWNIK